jgi:predicted nucleic acid-binding protein
MPDLILALDSSAVIHHLNKDIDLPAFIDARYPGNAAPRKLVISVVTFMEALSKPGMSSAEEQTTRQFLDTTEVVELLPVVRDEAIRIRRVKSLKLPDAIVAATSIISNATLLSTDPHLCKFVWPGYSVKALV